MILRGKLHISKICEFFWSNVTWPPDFSDTGLKEIKYNILVKLMQDTTTYVLLIRFYVATIAALSSIQLKSKLRT